MFVNVTRTLQSELKGPGILVGKVMLGKRETMQSTIISTQTVSGKVVGESASHASGTMTSIPIDMVLLETGTELAQSMDLLPIPKGNTKQSGPFLDSQQFQFYQLSKALLQSKSRQIIACRPKWAKFGHLLCLNSLHAKNSFYSFKW